MRGRLHRLLATAGLLMALVSGALADDKTPAKPDKAVRDAIAQLKNSNPEKRAEAVKTLIDMGPKAAAAVPALTNVMLRDQQELRVYAAEAMGKIGKASLDPLMKGLKNRDEGVRAAAAHGIARIGPDAKAAVPTLIKMLNERQGYVRVEAELALAGIGPDAKEAVPHLIQALKERPGSGGGANALVEEDIRCYAGEALGKIGPASKEAVPALMDGLKAKELRVRMGAAKGLAGIGPASKPAVPALIAALKEKDKDLQMPELVADALGAIGPDAKEAVPALLEARKGAADVTRLSIDEALPKIDPEAAKKAGIR